MAFEYQLYCPHVIILLFQSHGLALVFSGNSGKSEGGDDIGSLTKYRRLPRCKAVWVEYYPWMY